MTDTAPRPPPRRPPRRRRRRADPRQPRPAQRDVGRDDRVLGRRGRRARRRPRPSAPWWSPARARAFCSGGNTGWIASEPDADRRPPAHPDDRVLPGLAVDPPARGADHRRGQRAGDRRRAVPGAGLRHPVRRRGGPARRAVREARHARRDGRDVPAARTSSARRTPATCCSPAGWWTPTRRCGSAWSPGCSRPTTFLDDGAGDRRRASPRPRRSPAGSPRSRCATAGTPTSRPRVQWEALAQPITLATADLQEGIAAAREKRPPRFTGR